MSAGTPRAPERWQEIQDLFADVLERPAAERSGWLRTATVDEAVRAEVRSLLAAHANVDGILDGPPPSLPPGAIEIEELLQPGDRLGPYEIVAPLGRGGMGILFVAHDTRLGRDVAVKLLAPQLARDPRSLRRFEREARAVAALAHPNIVSLFDVGQEQERAYAVMELLEGETLRERLARGPLSVPEALRVARDVARGLGAAHAKGLVHRDLKPDNVFLTASGSAKILDFGIARMAADPEPAVDAGGATAPATAVTPTELATTLVGTAGYVSPEQARGEATDARTDVFAFGCVLYECLAGRRAFEGRDLGTAIAAVLRDTPQPLRRVRVETPRVLAAVVERCLGKLPDERYASGSELSAALDPLAAEAEARALFAGRWRRPALVSAVALLLIAAAVYGHQRWRERDIQPGTPGGLVFRRNPTDGAEYSRIPPGTFGMGCDPSGPRRMVPCDSRAQPFTQVTIARPYWMMRTEVTQGEYALFAKATGTPMPGPDRVEPLPPRMAALPARLFAHADLPIVEVNWHEADLYCRWAGGRLPSESEWERAARANHDWDFVWDARDLQPGAKPLANVRDESTYRTYGPIVRQDGTENPDARYKGYDDGFPDLAPVGSFPPNDFGLYDMGGNVAEWVFDHAPGVFQAAPYVGFPTDGSPRLDWDGSARMMRFGAWFFGPNAQAVWTRDSGSAFGRSDGLGFRCARDTPP